MGGYLWTRKGLKIKKKKVDKVRQDAIRAINDREEMEQNMKQEEEEKKKMEKNYNQITSSVCFIFHVVLMLDRFLL